jgi:hypothetical protein
MKRLTVLISLVALSSLYLATPVLAAAPGNDDASTPTVITSLPYTQDPPLDTTEATQDPSTDQDCFGFGLLNASVWYAFTTGADPVTLIADTGASDYTTAITVTEGSPTGPTVTCGVGGAVFPGEPDTTYYFMVAACFNGGGVGPAAIGCDPTATGGSLVFSLDQAPPPPTVDVTVNPIGQFNKTTGSATISGTVLCSGDATETGIQIELSQSVGRFTISGFGGELGGFVCDGTTQAWSIEVFGNNGKFKGGRASSITSAGACNEFSCSFDTEERIVSLRG